MVKIGSALYVSWDKHIRFAGSISALYWDGLIHQKTLLILHAQFTQQLPDTFVESRVNQIRCQVVDGTQHEFPVMHTWMRHNELFCVNNPVIEKNNIKIKGSRPEPYAAVFSAKFDFKCF